MAKQVNAHLNFFGDIPVGSNNDSHCITIKGNHSVLVKPSWISVKERLPLPCEHVLIYCPTLKSMTVGYLIYDENDEPMDFCIVDFDEYEQTASLDDISYWMPLPEVPRD